MKNDDSFEFIENQFLAVRPLCAPRELRGEVLASVERELRAARWDRRLAQTAAVLILVGVGLNVGIIFQEAIESGPRTQSMAVVASRQSLVDTAVLVAEATDATTGSRFAHQLAALSGRELTADEAAAIDAAVERSNAVASDDKGSEG